MAIDNREVAEELIYRHMMGIKSVLDEYCPDDKFFSAAITEKAIFFNNKYWEHEDGKVINYFKANEEE